MLWTGFAAIAVIWPLFHNYLTPICKPSKLYSFCMVSHEKCIQNSSLIFHWKIEWVITCQKLISLHPTLCEDYLGWAISPSDFIYHLYPKVPWKVFCHSRVSSSEVAELPCSGVVAPVHGFSWSTSSCCPFLRCRRSPYSLAISLPKNLAIL